MSDNPYAPPIAEGPTAAVDVAGVWREGDQLVWRIGAAWPDRCLRCNGPVARHYRRDLIWHAPGWYLTILLGPLLYIIVALIVRQRVPVRLGLCHVHADLRTNRLLAAWGTFTLGIIAMVSGCSSSSSSSAVQILVGLALVFGALVAIAVVSPLVRVVRIDRHQARATGLSPDYLAGLDLTSEATWRS